MAAETQYTANTGQALIATANALLDGTGTLGTVLTAAGNGTLIKNITVKALVNTTEGMVRLFLFDGTNNRLLEEIRVRSVTKSATVPAFEYTWECDIKLKAGWALKASTQNAQSFVVTANAKDWAYNTLAVRPESTNFTANTGLGLISVANALLDGTGTLVTVFTAGVAATFKGCRIEGVTIKATVTTTRGMVRLFLFDGTNTRLLTEVPIPETTRTGTEPTFEIKVPFKNLDLKAGWAIRASTQNAESFAITVEGNDWKYPV
jgi:hypothetical protein